MVERFICLISCKNLEREIKHTFRFLHASEITNTMANVLGTEIEVRGLGNLHCLPELRIMAKFSYLSLDGILLLQLL